jgi:hypothetical protein
MRFNQHLDRLAEVPIVSEFMHRHGMRGKVCRTGENYSFILFRLPYVVEFRDDVTENYLEIRLSDISCALSIEGGSALGCSLDLGLQTLVELRSWTFDKHPLNDIFLSDGSLKMGYLYSDLDAFEKLLPLIEAKGGLSSMRDGTFDPRFDFKDSVQPMYPGLKEKYLRCIDATG